MPDYFHSALRGEQIHESRVKVLPAGSSFPVPEWEGQLLVLGGFIYYAVKQNSVLTWVGATAYNPPILPTGTIKWESGFENPPTPRTPNDSGVFYVNSSSQRIWYLNNGQWLRLGLLTSEPTFEIVGTPIDYNNGNYFELNTPINPLHANCLIVSKWQSNKKYYFTIKTPLASSLSSSIVDNTFYLGLWRDWQRVEIASCPQNSSLSVELDTVLFTPSEATFRLGMYCFDSRYGYNEFRYLNFIFDFEARLLQPFEFASIFYY